MLTLVVETEPVWLAVFLTEAGLANDAELLRTI